MPCPAFASLLYHVWSVYVYAVSIGARPTPSCRKAVGIGYAVARGGVDFVDLAYIFKLALTSGLLYQAFCLFDQSFTYSATLITHFIFGARRSLVEHPTPPAYGPSPSRAKAIPHKVCSMLKVRGTTVPHSCVGVFEARERD
jgi:hypothetical protein